MSLQINNLHVRIEEKEILHGVNLEVEKGELHVIMGPNGSGKSSLANSLMGHPKYEITEGSIILDGEDITELDPHKRAKAGLFLSMQEPPEIEGVTMSTFLRAAVEARTEEKQHPVTFFKQLESQMEELGVKKEVATRYVNLGFSGGEKKRAEILQLSVLNPTYAILDETDSGLDVDALRVVSEGMSNFKNNEHGVLLITHYNRILQYVVPDRVHIMIDGKIVESGGKELAEHIEVAGYTSYGA